MAATSELRVRLTADASELDRQMDEVQRRRLGSHPTTCPTCRHREQRILERAGRDRTRRRVLCRRWFFVVLFCALLVWSWYRLGSPAALVMLQEGGR